MKKYIGILILLFIFLGIFIFVREEPKEVSPDPTLTLVEHIDAEYGIHFHYLPTWGPVSEIPGISICPEEDTYRTLETVAMTDKELSFPDVDLPDTDSFIRRGVKIHTLDPNNLNACGDEFLLSLARGEVVPETISSFKLTSVEINGLKGVYNPNASRLNTEGRIQYTLFAPVDEKFVVIQPYLSFIPYYGSPELEEMEETFSGDMEMYLAKGVTAAPVRHYLAELSQVSASIRIED